MSRARRVTRVCGSCRKTLLSSYNPGDFCTPCERALFDRQHLTDPDGRDDMAAWVWDTGPMRDALARLDFPAVLVIYRSAAAGLLRRELGRAGTGLSESVIWYWEGPAVGRASTTSASSCSSLTRSACPARRCCR